jgi:Ca-activated chloride channel family protein
MWLPTRSARSTRHPLVVVSRTTTTTSARFETTNYRAADDFRVLRRRQQRINANLLTYLASAAEDGFFMLMITPPTKVDASRVIPEDVIFVLDQSGSMQGQKWDQARAAASYVLKHLNPQDRFNAIVFSTGFRIYAKTLQPVS